MIKFFFKITVLVILTIIVAEVSCAQSPVNKLYAYSRKFIAGRAEVKAGIGKKPVVSSPVVRTEYYFFLEGDIDTSKLKCTGIWINKKSYSINGIKKIETPFLVDLKSGDDKSNRELVPATNYIVLQIWPGKISNRTPSKRGRQLIAANKLVIEINYGQKKYYLKSKNIITLSPAEDV